MPVSNRVNPFPLYIHHLHSLVHKTYRLYWPRSPDTGHSSPCSKLTSPDKRELNQIANLFATGNTSIRFRITRKS